MSYKCAVSTILALSIAPTLVGPAYAQDTIKLGMVMPLTGAAGDSRSAGSRGRALVYQAAR